MLEGKQNTLFLSEVWKISKSFGFCSIASLPCLEERKFLLKCFQELPQDCISSMLFPLWRMKPQCLQQKAPGDPGAWPSLYMDRIHDLGHAEFRGFTLTPPSKQGITMAGSCCSWWISELGFFPTVTQLLLSWSLSYWEHTGVSECEKSTS